MIQPIKSAVTKVLRSPRQLLVYQNRFINKYIFDARNSDTRFVNEDWDNLLLLDACRADMFQEVARLPGDTETRVSPASSTPEFIRACLEGKSFQDVVYVTANPQIDRIEADITFHDIVRVWKTEGWDEEEGTVLPQTMTDAVIDVSERYPHKRILAHYMQPHYPFIGDDEGVTKGHLQEGGFGLNIWQQRMTGKLDISDDELWDLYVKNLKAVLPHIERALKELEGKTVVSADHGNAFGEEGVPIPVRTWGHPTGQAIPEIVTVPWHVHVNSDRRLIVKGESSEDTEQDDDVIGKRLRDLGYLE